MQGEENLIKVDTFIASAMEECIYCSEPTAGWDLLKAHLKQCDKKTMVDQWRDEFKSVYGFYPSFNDVRDVIDQARHKKETQNE